MLKILFSSVYSGIIRNVYIFIVLSQNIELHNIKYIYCIYLGESYRNKLECIHIIIDSTLIIGTNPCHSNSFDILVTQFGTNTTGYKYFCHFSMKSHELFTVG